MAALRAPIYLGLTYVPRMKPESFGGSYFTSRSLVSSAFFRARIRAPNRECRRSAWSARRDKAACRYP